MHLKLTLNSQQVLKKEFIMYFSPKRPVLFSAFAAPFIPLSFIDENLPIIFFLTIVQTLTCLSYFLIFLIE